jgi:hypothetical protein
MVTSSLESLSILYRILGSVTHGYEDYTISWDITPCNPWKVERRFAEKSRLHLQGRKISQQETNVKQVASSAPEDRIFTRLCFQRNDGKKHKPHTGNLVEHTGTFLP